MAEKEYIERGAVLHELLYAMCGTGYQSRAMDAVHFVPAADVVEVRHGEWIVTKTEFGWNSAEYPTEYTCSVCGRTEPQKEPYCHCGAKMDGGRKHD